MNQNVCQRLLFVMLLNKLRIRRSEHVKIYKLTSVDSRSTRNRAQEQRNGDVKRVGRGYRFQERGLIEYGPKYCCTGQQRDI